jgi:hypothetical protein
MKETDKVSQNSCTPSVYMYVTLGAERPQQTTEITLTRRVARCTIFYKKL